MSDVALTVGLTGFRTWHSIIPEISIGGGLVSDLGKKADVGGYRFGTPFAFTLGSGIRWVPGGRWQVRADLTDRLYRIKYPQSYYLAPATGEAPILGPRESASAWRHNPSLSIGLGYLFDR